MGNCNCTDRGCHCDDHYKNDYAKFTNAVVGGPIDRETFLTERELDRLCDE